MLPNATLIGNRNPKKINRHYSELRDIIQNLDFLTRLEGRKTHVRTSIAAERITESTASTGTRLALDGEV